MFAWKGQSGRRGGASVPKRFAAIDFDSRSLHIVCARRTRAGARIEKLTHAAIPEDLDTADANAFGAFLGKTLRTMRLGIKAVVMNVPRGLAVLKPLQFPPGTAYGELAGMVQFQVEKELPFPMAEAVVDFTRANHYDTEEVDDHPHVNVLVSAVRLPVVEHYKQIALAAGVKLFRLGLRPVATMRCVAECLGAEASGPLAVIHVTADETEIMVFSGGTLAFSRSALFAESLSEHPDQSEASPQSRRVAGEIARSLQTYQAAEGGAAIERVLLAGGTGIEAGVARSLRKRLGVSCEPFNPAEALRLGEDEGASAYIASLGMAVGHDGSATPFDFLNPKRPRVRRNVKAIRRGAMAAAAGVVLAAGVVAGSMWVGGKQDRVAALRREAARLKKDRKPCDTRIKHIKALDEWDQSGVDILGHWTYVSSVAPPCTDLYITSLKMALTDGVLKFNVRARDDTAIIKLGQTLRNGEDKYGVRTGRVSTGEDKFRYLYGTTINVSPPQGRRADLTDVKPPPGRPRDDVSHLEKYR